MERPADGEDAEQVRWHIAYLLAGEMTPQEALELARLRRVKRWLAVAALEPCGAPSAAGGAITVMGGGR